MHRHPGEAEPGCWNWAPAFAEVTIEERMELNIFVNKNTKVIVTGATRVRAAGGFVDGGAATTYFTHNLCKCGIRA